MAAGNVAAAAELFADDSYWRDLIAFTWNIKPSRAEPRSPTCSMPARAGPAAQLADRRG